MDIESKITIMYDRRKHNDSQVINCIVDPFISEVLGVTDDIGDYSKCILGLFDQQIEGYEIDTSWYQYRHKDSVNSGIRRFAKKHSIDLEKLTGNTYFLRSLRKR